MTPAEMVREFHEAFGLVIRDSPTLPNQDEREFRAELIREEYAEAWDELESGGSIDRVASELADILYVVYGTALHYGVNLDAVVAEVHRANMSKLAPCKFCRESGDVMVCDDCHTAVPRPLHDFPCSECGAVRCVVQTCNACAGKGRHPLKREDGKVLKGPNYQPPDVAGAIGL